MVTKNVFSGEMTTNFCYGGIGSYSSVEKKLNDGFWNLGIQQIRNFGGVAEDELVFEKITLVVFPNVFDLINQPSEKLSQFLKTNFSTENGYNDVICINRIVEILEDEHTSLFRDGVRYADYYPKRNCILLYFNPFVIVKGQNNQPFMGFFNKFLAMLTEDFEKLDIRIYDVSQIRLQRAMNSFMKNMKEQYRKTGLEIIKREADIEKYHRQIVVWHHQNILGQKMLEYLKRAVNNFSTEFQVELENLKTLPFVKDVSINQKGIKVEVGDISLTYKGKSVYLGNYAIYILPNRVEVINKYPIDHFHHMHVSGTSVCLGTRRDDVDRLLGSFKLKELVFLMFTFLKSYNEKDKYFGFDEWCARRKAENKFDEHGNLLQSIEEKKEEQKQLEVKSE